MKKNLIYFIGLALSAFLSVNAQNISFSTVRPINTEQHGFSYVNFFNNCTDTACLNKVVNLKPRFIRFPSAGDADNFFLNFDSLGYGIQFSKVASYLADRYGASSNPLTTPPFTSYTVPAAFDPAQPVLNYNASAPTIFSSNGAASSYTTQLIEWFCNYRRQQSQFTSSYMTLFKQHIKNIENTLQPGEKVNVVYVANIFSGTPDDLIKTLTQLTSPSITPVNVVGIELSNESWGKLNNDLFPDPNSGNQFYYYVVDSSAYSGCVATKGNFIKKLRSNFPNIKIGFPAAPLQYMYYGCNMGSSSGPRFNAWNLEHKARNTQSITVTLASNSTTATFPLFDAYVTHNYYDEKYWGVDSSEILAPSCISCLVSATVNTANPKKYKNYLREVASNTASPNFNHAFAYFPMNDDDTLRASFDCQLKESFKWIDSGYVDQLLSTYVSSLALTSSNNKKIWTTEWNFHEGTDDTTNIFANTFNQAVLTMGWRMAMYRANWKFSGSNDFLQYSAYFNGVAPQQNAAISKRNGTTTTGDGTYDGNSGYIRRMGYWSSLLTRHISLDSLKWIDNQCSNFPTNQNLRFYSFVDQTNSHLYLYYINATNNDQYVNADSLNLSNIIFDTTGIYREYFSVKNNYSTGGYGTLYEQNKYYKTGPNFTKLFPNDPMNTYTVSTVIGKKQTLKRKSIGVIKYNIYSTVGLTEQQKNDNSFAIYPNPSNNTITIKLKYADVKGSVIITDLLGKTVKQFELEKNMVNTDVSGLTEGVYLVRIVSKHKTMCQKLIIAK